MSPDNLQLSGHLILEAEFMQLTKNGYLFNTFIGGWVSLNRLCLLLPVNEKLTEL